MVAGIAALTAALAVTGVLVLRSVSPQPANAVLAAGSGSVAGGAPGEAAPQTGVPAPWPQSAAFLGDSITVGDSDLASGRIGELSWFAGLVQGDSAPLRFDGGAAEIGMTTDWMAEHVGQALAARPDWLVVLGGSNDLPSDIPLPTSLANLGRIIDAADLVGTKVALATIPPQRLPEHDPTVDMYNAAVRDLAAQRSIVLLDTHAAVADNDGGWLPGLTTDGIHPSVEGARLMAAKASADLRAQQ